MRPAFEFGGVFKRLGVEHSGLSEGQNVGSGRDDGLAVRAFGEGVFAGGLAEHVWGDGHKAKDLPDDGIEFGGVVSRGRRSRLREQFGPLEQELNRLDSGLRGGLDGAD